MSLAIAARIAACAASLESTGAGWAAAVVHSTALDSRAAARVRVAFMGFGYDDRMAINKSAFDALKPGGLYGIVDHTRRHNEPDNRENGRRVDPVLVIKEVQDSGFILEDYAAMARSPEDALIYEVGNPAVSGKTDRFVLLFKKRE